MIILIFVLIGAIEALMDSGTFYNYPTWMNPANYWRNKYKNNDPNQGYKWWGLSEFLVLDD